MLLRVNGLTHRHPGGTREVLRDVSFEVARGESVALTGESGSGKSTLLHMLAALDRPTSGQIRFADQEITALSDRAASQLRRNRIALVFQQFNLIPALTVAENIALHAKLGERFEPGWCDEVTTRLGLAELAQRYPEQISGGQQQRVAIARALALRPDLLLADEPTGNLDETASAEVLRLMLELVTDTGCALFLVTHSSAIASRCTRHLHLSAGEVRDIPR